MKVKELIEKLEALDNESKELEVKTEGCDCFGETDLVFVNHGEGVVSPYVLITRPEFRKGWEALFEEWKEQEKQRKINAGLQLEVEELEQELSDVIRYGPPDD